MGTTLVLALSVTCQVAAAVLAFRLIRLTGKRWAWGLVAGAILLMVARRCLPLVGLSVGGVPPGASLAFELLGLAISLMLLAGIAGIYPLFGLSREMVAIKRAEEALRASEVKYRTLYDSSRDAIMMLTPEKGFFSGNPAAVALFGCHDEAEFTSLTPAELSPAQQPDGSLSAVKAQQMMARALQEGAHFFEWTHQRRDGHVFCASVLLTRMELQGRAVLQATVRDISVEKQAAEALRMAKEAAEAASYAKSVFLATMSHEIRTPLNAIIGMTDLALNTPLSPLQQDYLATVKDSAEALLGVINDILDFSRIEAGRLTFERIAFALRQVLGDTLKSLALRAQEEGLRLDCRIAPDVPAGLTGDPSRLRQVVVNLVGNAIKFTEQGEVVLEVAVESREERRVLLHFAVRDTGIGIPAEKQTLIFRPFEQVDGTLTRRHGGSGLGLAISSRLVEQMGGRIWVESRVGQGSTFHFVVGFELATTEPAPLDRAEPPVSADLPLPVPLRILLVEDSLVNQKLATALLAGHGHTVVVANNGREALAALESAGFDLVLMDVQMPELDGLAATALIRAREKETGRHVPIVAMTAHALKGDRERCLAAGMDDYLSKPIRAQELFGTLRRVLFRGESTANG